MLLEQKLSALTFQVSAACVMYLIICITAASVFWAADAALHSQGLEPASSSMKIRAAEGRSIWHYCMVLVISVWHWHLQQSRNRQIPHSLRICVSAACSKTAASGTMSTAQDDRSSRDYATGSGLKSSNVGCKLDLKRLRMSCKINKVRALGHSHCCR